MNALGILVRLLAAALLVHLTYNPFGFSYYDWALEPLFRGPRPPGHPSALMFLGGVLLLIGWAVFVQATRRSLGMKGALLVVALGGGVVWLLVEQGLLSARGAPAITEIILAVISLLLGIGLSWSLISRRLTGQVDTDESD
ncbi:MAG: DUF6524 family protein [Gemmatimonadota bacterium]|nr:hypothetical protein [Gemmatimonadota bacterium]